MSAMPCPLGGSAGGDCGEESVGVCECGEKCGCVHGECGDHVV